MTKKEEIKIEQGGLIAKLREDLSSDERIKVRKRLAEIGNELSALEESHSKHYLFVRSYDPKAKQFSLYKSPSPIKADVYYVVVQTHTIRLVEDKLVRTKTGGKMYLLKSGSQQYYLQSRDKLLLQQYISHLAIDNVAVAERLSKKEEARREKEAWAHDGDMVKPLNRVPRSGHILLEGRKIK